MKGRKEALLEGGGKVEIILGGRKEAFWVKWRKDGEFWVEGRTEEFLEGGAGWKHSRRKERRKEAFLGRSKERSI